jgi:predicted N-formylglutamate amidohydrolase
MHGQPIDPPAVTVENEAGQSPYLFLCEHASNHIGAEYGRLGLPEAELKRHIAWDIGAAQVARGLSRLLDAPLILSGYSRLLIDCNRPPGSPTSIPETSEDTIVPGNLGLTIEERARREALYFHPFWNAARRHLSERHAAGHPTFVVGIHSFTRIFRRIERPWHAGVLYRRARAFGEAMLAALADPALLIAANEPYRITDLEDFTVPHFGEANGASSVLIEIRNDMISSPAGVREWIARLARAQSDLIPRLHRMELEPLSTELA